MENMNIGSNNKKKRNISHALAVDHNGGDDDDDDDEEKKIDKFFALINRIREARDLLINNYGAAGAEAGLETKDYYLENNIRKKSKQVQNGEEHHLVPTPLEANWKPLFQREDFMDEDLLRFNAPPTPTFTFGSSSSPNVPAEKDESAKEGLDLKLSL